MLLNRTTLSLPASPLRYIEDAGDHSVYLDPYGDEWYLQHGTGRVLVAFDDFDIPEMWVEFGATISPYATNLSINSRQRRFIEYLAERTYEPEDLDQVEFCKDCERPNHGDELEPTNSHHGLVCESCVENYYCCDDCEERFPSTTTTLHDSEVCEDCRGRNWSYCEDCDGLYRDVDAGDHTHVDEDDDENLEDNGCCSSPAFSFAIRNDGQEPLHNDVSTTVTLPAGQITDVGIGAIANRLRQEAQTCYDRYSAGEMTEKDYSDVYNKWHQLSYSLSAIGNKWQAKEGNFTKRLSRYAHQTFGLKVPPAVVSQIGNIASDHSRAIDHIVAITRDLNLSAADFAHGGSCWWSCYSNSRCALKSNGGFGLRTFDANGYVVGRAWVLPLKQVEQYGMQTLTPTFESMEPDAFVVFNGYGNLGDYTAPRILAHMAGMTYRKIGFSCSPMYVNSDSGYLVAPEEIAAPYTDGHLGLEVQQHSNLFRIEEARRAEVAAATTIEELVHV